MNTPRACERCGRLLGNAASTSICPACVAQLGNASWLDEPDDEVTTPRPDPMRIRYFGDYELLEEIAHGGMGVVFKARQVSLNRVVAVKMIRSSLLASEADIRRFRTEAEAAGSLQHPNIVAIHEVGEHEDQHYFSMDYLTGYSLARLVREHPWPAERAAACVKTIAEAIHYAHQRGILHLDLKPSNVVMDDDGEPHVTDFGLAKRLGGETGLTITGAVLGTPSYMSPEQAGGKRAEVSAASDVYSLGAILYELLAGRPPFQGETTLDTVKLASDTEAVSPRLLNPNIPRDVETICLKCLEKDPIRRYRSAQELAEDLGRFLRHEPVQARRATNPERVWRWCRRKPAVASLAGVAVLLFALGTSGVVWQWRRAVQSANEATQNAEHARQNLYAADMKQAFHFVEKDAFGDALLWLERYRPPNKSEIGNRKPETDLRGFEWRYLWQLCQGDKHEFLPAKEGRVWWLDFSPDGKYLAVAADLGVTVFDRNLRKVVIQLEQSAKQEINPHHALFTPDGSTLIIASHDQIKFFETTHWTEQPSGLPPGGGPIALSRDGSALAFRESSPRFVDGKIHTNATVWNLRTHKISFVLTNVDGPLLFSPDGRRLATDAPEGIKLWPLDSSAGSALLMKGSSNLFGHVSGHSSLRKAMAFSPDGRMLAAGGYQGDIPIMLWEAATGRRLDEDNLTNHPTDIGAVAFSPDGSYLATGDVRGTVIIWDVAARKFLKELRGHLSAAWSLAFAPDGKNLIVSGYDSITIWETDFARSQETQDFKGRWWPRWISANGEEMVTQGVGKLEFWNTITREVIHVLPRPNTPPPPPESILQVSANGQMAFAGYSNGVVRFASFADGEIVALPGGHTNEVTALAAKPDGKTLVSGARDRRLCWWELPSGRLIRSTTLSGAVNALAVSPDSKTLVSASKDGKLCWWELGSGKLLSTNSVPEATDQIVFSPDGKTLATVHDGGARLWDVATRALTRPLKSTYDQVAFSPNGRMLVSNAAVLWDTLDGKSLGILWGHSRLINGVVFSPDGRTIATAADDGTMRLFSVDTCQEVFIHSRKGTSFSNPMFSADGRTLVAGSGTPDGGGLHIWRAPSFDEIEALEKANLHNH